MTCNDAMAALALARTGGAAAREAEAHASGCTRCAGELGAARRLATLLAADETATPVPAQVERTMATAAPLLARRKVATRARRWRLARALAAAVLPLPLVLWLDMQLIRGVHGLAERVFPPAVSTYLSSSLGVLLALLLALAYAVVPLAAGRLATSSPARARLRRAFAAGLPSAPDSEPDPDPEEANA